MGWVLVVVGALMLAGVAVAALRLRARPQPPQSHPYGVPAFGWGQNPPGQPGQQVPQGQQPYQQQWPPTGGSSTPGG